MTPTDPRRIKISENGPYLVSGGVPLAQESINPEPDGTVRGWRRDKEIQAGENYSLCRCGRSRKKPFCDGVHEQANFDGAETASREPFIDQADKVEGPGLDLADAPELCAGSRFCHREGGIWGLIPRSDDPEARRVAIEVAGDCPAGRLVVSDKEGKTIEPEFGPSIAVVDDPQEGVNGPIWVRGGIPIESADGAVYEQRNRVTLCRCGKSRNKPFCDGSHLD